MTAEQNDDYDNYYAPDDSDLIGSTPAGYPAGYGQAPKRESFLTGLWHKMGENKQGILAGATGITGVLFLKHWGIKVALTALGFLVITAFSSIPQINGWWDRTFVNTWANPAAHSQEHSTQVGSWAGVDDHGDVWSFTLNSDGTVTDILRAIDVEGMAPSADRLAPVGVLEGSVWHDNDHIRFAQVWDGASLKWEIDEVRPASSDEQATSLVLSTDQYSFFGNRKLIVERVTAPEDGGEVTPPVLADLPADPLYGSVWFGSTSEFEDASLRFNSDGTGVLRTGGMATNYKLYDFTFHRVDHAGTRVEQGDYVQVVIPDAGKFGSITLTGLSQVGKTVMGLEGISSTGEEFTVEADASYGAYAPVPEDTLTRTVWVGETSSGAVAAVRWDTAGVAEVKLKDFGTKTYGATWTVAGSAVTLSVTGKTPADSITFTGTIAPHAESLTLNGMTGDGKSSVMTLRLAEVLTASE